MKRLFPFLANSVLVVALLTLLMAASIGLVSHKSGVKYPRPLLADDRVATSALDDEVVAPYVAIGTQFRTFGAGTVINIDGTLYILTCGHVAEEFQDPEEEGQYLEGWLRQESEDGREITLQAASVVAVWYTVKVDLALLKPAAPARLVSARYTGEVKLARGQDCWYIGTPGGLYGGLEKSIINRPLMRRYQSGSTGSPYYWGRTVFNGNAWYGNSGGGLYVLDDGHYTLVGVVAELNRYGEKASGMAISQTDINTFLDKFRKEGK